MITTPSDRTDGRSADARAADLGLSVRHVQILQLIADGNSTKETARILGIAPKTVHNHLNSIYRLLGTQSLTHAILAALRLEIIELR